MRIKLLYTCLFYLLSFHVFADNSGSIRVVELFTSQGCHSCPPADLILGNLKKRPNLITLSCHVTYWNYLGWRDTFSKPFCDERQRLYQHHLKGRAGVYTPQLVINGRNGVVGSSLYRVNQQLKVTDQIAAIRMELRDHKLSIHLPHIEHIKTQQLLLIGTSGEHRLPIGSGENSGKTLSYHNPIEVVIDLGPWRGNPQTIEQKVENHLVKEWVALSQEYPLGSMTSAGKITVN